MSRLCQDRAQLALPFKVLHPHFNIRFYPSQLSNADGSLQGILSIKVKSKWYRVSLFYLDNHEFGFGTDT